MNELALFAGAGGGILGGKLLGQRTVCAVEVDAYCTGVLLQRQNDGVLPPFPVWDDVCTFDGKPWRGIVDVVSGGFPCQAYSSASAGKKVADDLWPEMRRILADVSPRYVFVENVSRIAIENAGQELCDMGYKAKALSFAASDLGLDSIRTRYWLFAHADDKGELLREVNAEVEICEGIQKSLSEVYSRKPGMDARSSRRMDRLKAIGNGQVPQCAALAWRILRDDRPL